MTTFKELTVGSLFRLVGRVQFTYEKVQRCDAYNAIVPGRGFYCVVEDDAAVELVGGPPPQEPVHQTVISVLFVEDDPAILSCYSDLADHFVWHYEIARTVNEAEYALLGRGLPYSFIVLDHHVGPRKGYELIPSIRRNHPTATVVSASALSPDPRDYPGIPWISKAEVCRWILDRSTP